MAAARVSKSELASDLTAIGRQFYERGWVLGTSGNFSAVLAEQPLRLAITASAVHKGTLGPEQILVIDEHGRVTSGTGHPSAETLLHVEIVRARGARAVLHTHSVWSTILSDLHAADGGLEIKLFLDKGAPLELRLGKLDEKQGGYFATSSTRPGMVFVVPQARFTTLMAGWQFFEKGKAAN